MVRIPLHEQGNIANDLTALLHSECERLGVPKPRFSVQFRDKKHIDWPSGHYTPNKEYIYIGASTNHEHNRQAVLHELAHHLTWLVAKKVGLSTQAYLHMEAHGETFYRILNGIYNHHGYDLYDLVRKRWEYPSAKRYVGLTPR
jgi:hypothetical protein